MTNAELVGALKALALPPTLPNVTRETLLEYCEGKKLREALTDDVLRALELGKQSKLVGATLGEKAIPQAVLWLNESYSSSVSSEGMWF